MKKVWAAVLALSLTTGTYIMIDFNFSPVSAAVQKAASVKLTKKAQAVTLPFVEGKVEYPQISGMQNTKLQAELNKRFIYYANETNKRAAELNQMGIEYPLPYGKYGEGTTYTITRNKGGILSVLYTNYEYSGGAHGNYYYSSFNTNLSTGKNYTLKELFKPGTKYISILSNEIKRQLATQKKYPDFDKAAFKTIPSNQPFYLTDKGIVIYFTLYEYTSYATGIPEFEIPYARIRKYLAPEI